MNDNTMPERLWVQYNRDDDTSVEYNAWHTHDDKFTETEYIRADVAQAQLDAERKRIVNAIDAILNWQSGYEKNVIAAALKAAVWNDEDDPREILVREIRHMESRQ